MSDPQRPFDALRDVEVPTGAKQRVRERLQGRRRRSRLPFALLLSAAATAGVLVWALGGASDHEDRRQLASGERLELALPGGHASVRGPADVVVEDERVVLRSGTLATLGQVTVEGPGCSAAIDGSAEVTVSEATLVVRVFAGSAELSPATPECTIVEVREKQLPAPTIVGRAEAVEAVEAPPVEAPPVEATPAPAPVLVPPAAEAPAAPRPPREPRVRTPIAVEPEPAEPEPASNPALAEQLAAYRTALGLEGFDAEAALRAWRDLDRRFPAGPLAHEVGLRTVALLVKLGRRDEARRAAGELLERFPASPRRNELMGIRDAAP